MAAVYLLYATQDKLSNDDLREGSGPFTNEQYHGQKPPCPLLAFVSMELNHRNK